MYLIVLSEKIYLFSISRNASIDTGNEEVNQLWNPPVVPALQL
jgi:hypothetical protein